jgi:hypothetical protein
MTSREREMTNEVRGDGGVVAIGWGRRLGILCPLPCLLLGGKYRCVAGHFKNRRRVKELSSMIGSVVVFRMSRLRRANSQSFSGRAVRTRRARRTIKAPNRRYVQPRPAARVPAPTVFGRSSGRALQHQRRSGYTGIKPPL